METLRGIIPTIPTETVEFIKTVPQKWKCDKCGVITGTFWRSSPVVTNGHHRLLNGSNINGGLLTPSPSPLSTNCVHRFCGQCLDTIFIGIQTVGKCPLDSMTIYKKQVNSR